MGDGISEQLISMKNRVLVLNDKKGLQSAVIPTNQFTVWNSKSCMRSWNNSWIADANKFRYAAKFDTLQQAIDFAKKEINSIAATPIRAKIFCGQLLYAKVHGENVEILSEPVIQLM